jgi:hypothetical protein
VMDGRVRGFCFSLLSKPTMRHTHPPIQYVLRLKRPGFEAGYSLPFTADGINVYLHPPYVCMECLIKNCNGRSRNGPG